MLFSFVHCSLRSFLLASIYLNSFPDSDDFCCLLITFAKSMDSDQTGLNVRPDLDPKCLAL